MRKRVLFHFHTHYSVDSDLTPEAIVDFARANAVQILAPTDHNTLRGAREIAELAGEHGIETIIGSEFSTDHGDIIGLFLHEDVFSRKAMEVLDEIHHQNGLAILPHPYKRHHLTDHILHGVDGIEVFNARLGASLNRLAGELAVELKKPHFFGADAHLFSELGLVIGEIDCQTNETLRESFARGMKAVQLHSTTPAAIFKSKMIASRRRGTPIRYLKSMVGMWSAQWKGARL